MKIFIAAIVLGLATVIFLIIQEEKAWDDIDRIEAELEDSVDIDPGIAKKDLRRLLVDERDIEGRWESKNWHDGINLRIVEKENGNFALECEAYGDLTGGWIGGILTLNKAIKEYSPIKPYIHFYLINTPEGRRLASPVRIRDWILEPEEPNWGVFESFASLERSNEAVEKVQIAEKLD